MNRNEDLKTVVNISSPIDSPTYQEIIDDNYALSITKAEQGTGGNRNSEIVCNSPHVLIKQEFYEYENDNLSIKQEEPDSKQEYLGQSCDKSGNNLETQLRSLEMNLAEDLKTVVSIPSTIYPEIANPGGNFALPMTKAEPNIEGDKNSEKICNSSDNLIKQEFYEYENLSIKQEELDIKVEYLGQSSDKPDINLETHTSNKAQKKSISCTICDYKCVRESCLNRHLAKHTEENLLSCSFCDYKSVFTSHLNRHLAKHTREKPFTCNICDYKFTLKSDLKRHLAKHTGEKPFSCNFCDYKSARKFQLKCHLAKHTTDKPFSCNICDCKFTLKSSLKRHLARHTGEKPFSCNFCDYKAARKFNLKCHLATHTGEKPFSCSFCDYKAAIKSNLKCHLAKHTEEKQFTCDICDYKSWSKFNLKRHLVKHTSEKPFSS